MQLPALKSQQVGQHDMKSTMHAVVSLIVDMSGTEDKLDRGHDWL